MTISSAVRSLDASVVELWAAVGELVIIVAEDAPHARNGTPHGLAAADALAEVVTDVQGDVAAARHSLESSSFESASGLLQLPQIASLLVNADQRHRTQFRSFAPVGRMRSATRRIGGQWPAWWMTVEKSAERCDQLFEEVRDALLVCFSEVAEIAALSRPFDGANPAGAVTASPSDSHRRIS